ncbi:haloacid dehalogenase-like hydrolase [Frateuria defendens]|uniref:haloacid dehalogenase-like hydrolase n=1 Tax=Frateuria defendens TaxID=2219559 RepID=UPI00066FD05D|nr:haloacid dehalogenase-like hydrolase [Frateuria defendens]
MYNAEPEAAPAQAAAAPALVRTVLFDFDGVLIHGDAFGLFVRERYARSPLRKLLAALALPWLLLRLLFGRWWLLRSLVHLALAGLDERRYARAAQAFAAALVRQPRRFNRDALQALRRHQAAGDRVIVVTGCEEVLVRGIFDELGLEGLEILASRLGPGWSGMRVRRHNFGPAKLRRLAEHGVDGWALAYSDSVHDLPMLKAAGEAVLVNGTPALCKRLEKKLGRAVTRVSWY